MTVKRWTVEGFCAEPHPLMAAMDEVRTEFAASAEKVSGLSRTVEDSVGRARTELNAGDEADAQALR